MRIPDGGMSVGTACENDPRTVKRRAEETSAINMGWVKRLSELCGVPLDKRIEHLEAEATRLRAMLRALGYEDDLK